MTRPTKIIIVGNGFGGVYVLKHLDKFFQKDKNVEITLIGEKNYFLFTPLLHEVATGGINPENIVESIHKVLGRCLSSFYLGKVSSINKKDQTVTVGEHTLSYDYLVLAPGAETNFYNIKGAEENALQLKTLDDAIKIKNHLIEKLEEASHIKDSEERKRKLSFVVVGGGPTGVELAAEMSEFLKDTFSHYYHPNIINDVEISLIQKAPELVPQFGSKIRKKALRVLKNKNIKVLLNEEVSEICPVHTTLASGEKINTETVIWVAGVRPKKLEFDSPVEISNDGRMIVNDTMQLLGEKNIFALGDAAGLMPKEKSSFLPALAQVAQKESRTVAENIKLLMKGMEPRPFFYKSSGNLISLGQWMAAGELMGINISGRFTWWLWRTVYLSKLISFKKKVRVAVDWTINLFAPRDIAQF